MHFSRRMDRTALRRPPIGLAAAVLFFSIVTLISAARGQNFLGFSSKFELSDSVQLDEAEAATKTHIERVKAFLANQQWDEAVETLRQVAENHAGKVVAVTPRRYISVREFCHMQIAALPPRRSSYTATGSTLRPGAGTNVGWLSATCLSW